MTREQALSTLQRLSGTAPVKLEIEHFGKGISSPERREVAAGEHQRVSEAYEAAVAEYDRIVREHPDLQRLAALRKELRAEKERLGHEKYYKKFAAWRRVGIALQDGCTGDTWTEVIELAEQRWSKR